MSLILLIDSVHAELAVALVRDDKAVFKIHKEQRTHDRNLNRLVTELLNEQNVKFTDIDAYAVVVGPGSWTGCRVGVAAVKGFYAGLPRPIFALKSLDAIGDPSALKCNLDNYFIKRGNEYACEKLESTQGYATLGDSVSIEEYRTRLIKQLRHVKAITAEELVPFYITDFQIKN